MFYCECFIENNLQNITRNKLLERYSTYNMVVGSILFQFLSFVYLKANDYICITITFK